MIKIGEPRKQKGRNAGVFGLGVAKNYNSANNIRKGVDAPTCFHIRFTLVLQNRRVSFAMENEQSSQQALDGESRRLEYKPPTLRKLGKLTHMTLAVGMTGMVDGGSPPMEKTS